MELVLSKDFLRSLDRMDPPTQDVVKLKIFDLQTRPRTPGFSLEQLANGLYSGRINDNLRLIMDIDDSQTIVLHVDNHDDAYAWATNHRVGVNEITGSIQVVDLEHLNEQVIHHQDVYTEPKLFEQYGEDYLIALGVPAEWILPVKEATRSHLEWLLEKLPSEAMERLLQLDDGILVPIPRNAGGAPLEHPDTQRHFVTVKAADDLTKALENPWAQWTVFLHPDQRELVNTSFSGPAKVSGGAGTGKTVVAVHRAFRLATENPSAKVLLTTFSRTLATRITQMVAVLSGGEDHIPENLEISNIHRIALRIWSNNHPGATFKAVPESDIKGSLESAMGLRIMGSLNPGFVLSEWLNVIDYWGISNLESYKTFPRTGRGTILGQRQRQDLWSIFGPVLEKLASTEGEMSFTQLAFNVAESSAANDASMFQHIIVDEIQDFGPAELSLVRALVHPRTDDLFLCGDAAQRIFRRPFSWSSVGIEIQGRSRHLWANYRNTGQIQELAETVLTGPSIGGDEEEEARDSVSLLTGAQPVIKLCREESDEIICLGEWLQDMIRLGYHQNEIAVFSRRSRTLSTIGEPALRMVGQLKRRDLQDSRPPSEDGISFGTMHRAKGLEFRAVAVIGCGERDLPDLEMIESACDDHERAEIIETERNLLHVALTRPREQLLVTCSGSPSEFLHSGTNGNRAEQPS